MDISLGLNVIDHIISLLRERQTRKNLFFDKNIESLFSEMALVHKDYLKSFVHIGYVIESKRNTSEDWKMVLNIVKEKSSELATLRVKLKALSYAMDKHSNNKKDDCAFIFFQECFRYFSISCDYSYPEDYPNLNKSTHISLTAFSLLERLVNMTMISHDMNTLLPITEKIRSILEQRWDAVVKAYSNARVAYVK